MPKNVWPRGPEEITCYSCGGKAHRVTDMASPNTPAYWCDTCEEYVTEGAPGPDLSSGQLPDLSDDPEAQEYLQTGPECPQCHGENTEFEGGPPSMMDHGTTRTLHCRDCDAEFEMDPFTGELAEGKSSRGVSSFDKFMDATLIKETHQRKVDAKVSPQRQIARGYQEHPLGRVRMGKTTR